MKKISSYLVFVPVIFLSVFAGCKKSKTTVTPADPVDSVTGTYTGTYRMIQHHTIFGTMSTEIDIVTDTTYTLSVTVQKITPDSFTVSSGLFWWNNVTDTFGRKYLSSNDYLCTHPSGLENDELVFNPSSGSMTYHYSYRDQGGNYVNSVVDTFYAHK